MRHCAFLHAKVLQSYQVSKFEILKKNSDILGTMLISLSKSDSIGTLTFGILAAPWLQGCKVTHLKDLYFFYLK